MKEESAQRAPLAEARLEERCEQLLARVGLRELVPGAQGTPEPSAPSAPVEPLKIPQPRHLLGSVLHLAPSSEREGQLRRLQRVLVGKPRRCRTPRREKRGRMPQAGALQSLLIGTAARGPLDAPVLPVLPRRHAGAPRAV